MFDHVEDKSTIHERETILNEESKARVQTFYKKEILKREKIHMNKNRANEILTSIRMYWV